MLMDILLVEDNEELGKLIRDFIRMNGYTILWVKSAEEGLESLRGEDFKLLLLDVMLPGQDGFTALSQIRKKYDLPVLMMSARADDDSQILGMETGADDYIAKPFSVQVLLSKIRALLRRSYKDTEGKCLTFEDLVLDPEKRTVTKGGVPIEIKGKEFEILQYLMQHAGKVVDKNELFDRIWGVYSDTEPNALNVYIRWLREKIEEDPKDPKYIRTVWRVGYKLGE